jgi:predicted secreted protein
MIRNAANPLSMRSSLLTFTASVLPTALLALIPLGACNRTPPIVERTDAAAGQQVTLRVGQQLRISLPENVTTGYGWQLDPSCAPSLHLQSDETAPPANALVGAGRPRSWLFTASALGSCNLRFVYARLWEKTTPVRVVTFPLKITTP